jgi:AraC-like DNA-binding protein
VTLLTRHAEPPLSSYVEALWYCDAQPAVPHQKERVLPNGRFQVVINLSCGGGAVCGLRSQYISIEPAAIQSAMGIVFRPGGARGFFAPPSSDFYNQIVPLDAVWGRSLTRLQERLAGAPTPREKLRMLEAALRQLLRTGSDAQFTVHDAVQHSLLAFGSVPHVRTVSDISKESGISRRRLSQLFREQVGMTPKLYCRLMRFRQVLRQIADGRGVNWADVASAGGYFDQAHLTHEFREFSGFSPTAFLEAERPSFNHVRVN